MWLYEDWLKKIMNRGIKKKNAENILQAQFEKYWIFKKWTKDLTRYWRRRENMTESERAIDRVARSKWQPPHRFKYVRWRVLVKNIYKK